MGSAAWHSCGGDLSHSAGEVVNGAIYKAYSCCTCPPPPQQLIIPDVEIGGGVVVVKEFLPSPWTKHHWRIPAIDSGETPPPRLPSVLESLSWAKQPAHWFLASKWLQWGGRFGTPPLMLASFLWQLSIGERGKLHPQHRYGQYPRPSPLPQHQGSWEHMVPKERPRIGASIPHPTYYVSAFLCPATLALNPCCLL